MEAIAAEMEDMEAIAAEVADKAHRTHDNQVAGILRRVFHFAPMVLCTSPGAPYEAAQIFALLSDYVQYDETIAPQTYAVLRDAISFALRPAVGADGGPADGPTGTPAIIKARLLQTAGSNF